MFMHNFTGLGSCACSEPNVVERLSKSTKRGQTTFCSKEAMQKATKKLKKPNADFCEHSDMLNYDWLKFISCLIIGWISWVSTILIVFSIQQTAQSLYNHVISDNK